MTLSSSDVYVCMCWFVVASSVRTLYFYSFAPSPETVVFWALAGSSPVTASDWLASARVQGC